MCETLICCCPVQVSEGARSQTRTVFVGQTASGEFFAMCACVVLQIRGARGPTQDSGAEEPGTLRACEGGRGLVTTTHHAVTQTTIQRETEEKKETEKKDRKNSQDKTTQRRPDISLHLCAPQRLDKVSLQPLCQAMWLKGKIHPEILFSYQFVAHSMVLSAISEEGKHERLTQKEKIEAKETE